MAAQFGAHEMMDIHEVLSCTINDINTFQLLRPHVKDQQLAQMIDHQEQFMINDYNNLVQMLQSHGMGQAIPYRTPKNASPKYGLHQPETQTPNTSMNELDDRDISSIVLGCHKASASGRIKAALECADPNLRRVMQQGAINCSEQAYEVWQYMNQQGYYQVPTMKEMTTNTMIQSYGQSNESMYPTNHLQQMGQPAASSISGTDRMNYGSSMSQASRINQANQQGYMRPMGYNQDSMNH
jgi:spore coat protein CotF